MSGVKKIAVAALWATLLANQGLAAPAVPIGWTVSKINEMACVASGPTDGQAQLSLAAIGPQFVMLISAPDFSDEQMGYQAQLAFDHHPAVFTPGLGSAGIIQIRMGRGESAWTVVKSSRIAITVAGKSLHFPLANSGAALDAVARCAGVATLAQDPEKPAVPIPGGGKWTLNVRLAGVPTRACSARLPGDQIDTMLSLNKAGKLILTGGHPDWTIGTGDTTFGLSVDGAPAVTLKAGLLDNIFLSSIHDDKLVERMRHAKTFDWIFPKGRIHSDVTGLGAALDAIRKCRAGA